MSNEKRLETLQSLVSAPSAIAINSIAAPHKILIVEDHPSVRTMLSHLFTSEGFKTVCAGDGQEGFELAVRENPDLVLTDLDMPRVNGVQLIGL